MTEQERYERKISQVANEVFSRAMRAGREGIYPSFYLAARAGRLVTFGMDDATDGTETAVSRIPAYCMTRDQIRAWIDRHARTMPIMPILD